MKLIYLALVALLLSGCFANSTNVYAPTLNRISTVKQKKELIADIGAGFSEHIITYNAFLQYSPLNNTGILTHFNYGNVYNSYGFAIGGYSGDYFKKNKKEAGYHFDAYLGYDFNRVKGDTNGDIFRISKTIFYYDYTFDYQYQVFSFQQGFHVTGEKFKLDLATRPSIINVLSVKIVGDYIKNHQRLLAPLNDSPFFITELSAKISYGVRRSKIYCAMSTALFNKEKFSRFRDPLTLGIGLNLYFSQF